MKSKTNKITIKQALTNVQQYTLVTLFQDNDTRYIQVIDNTTGKTLITKSVQWNVYADMILEYGLKKYEIRTEKMLRFEGSKITLTNILNTYAQA